MATLLRSLTARFSSSTFSESRSGRSGDLTVAVSGAMVSARELIDEDLEDDLADTTAPPWSTAASLFPAAMELAETFEEEERAVPSFRLPLPLQAYVAGGALALLAAWVGNHPPKASIENARGDVITLTEESAAAQPVAVESAVSEPSIDIASLPTVSIGKLPVSAILTIRVEELPNARR